MNISGRTKTCMVWGDPVAHSLSPALHNRCYELLGINDEFIFVPARVPRDQIAGAVAGVRSMGVHALAVTVPLKQVIVQYLDAVEDSATAIGAVNTVIWRNGKLTGANTDWIGVLRSFETTGESLQAVPAVVLGAGGAAAAAVYALLSGGASVTVLNRTLSRAEELARRFGCAAGSLDDGKIVRKSRLIFNATTVGMDRPAESPIPPDALQPHHIVFDSVYKPLETKLLHDAKSVGARTINGLEMFVHQAEEQFFLHTGRRVEVARMRQFLTEKGPLAR